MLFVSFSDNLPLPKMMCVAWYSLDVLFTSSTICHLCMISIDRYLTFKYPLRYGHSKKRKSTILKIFLVWLISLCIAGPLFLLSMFDKQSNVHYKGCGPESPVFVISATVASFYLPLLIMIVMYALTVKALRHQLQEQRRLAVTNSLPSREGSSYYQRKSSPRASPRRSPRLPGSLPSRSPDAGRSSSNSLREYSQPLPKPDPTTLTATTGDSYLPLKEPMHFLDTKPQSGCLSTSSTCTDIALQDLDDSSDTIQTTTTRKKHLKVRIFRFRQSMPANERSRRVLNGPDRGRRAVQVLGILFVVFVIFYLPFFAVYVINGTCVPCREYISPRMIMAFEWLQYTGSTVNPIVYHIFNPDFRRAFSKILHTQNCCK